MISNDSGSEEGSRMAYQLSGSADARKLTVDSGTTPVIRCHESQQSNSSSLRLHNAKSTYIRTAVAFLSIAFAGCSVTTYRDGSQQISRLSVGVNSQISSIMIHHGKNDSVQLLGFTGNQSQALEAVVKGAIEGAKAF